MPVLHVRPQALIIRDVCGYGTLAGRRCAIFRLVIQPHLRQRLLPVGIDRQRRDVGSVDPAGLLPPGPLHAVLPGRAAMPDNLRPVPPSPEPTGRGRGPRLERRLLSHARGVATGDPVGERGGPCPQERAPGGGTSRPRPLPLPLGLPSRPSCRAPASSSLSESPWTNAARW